MLAGERSRIRMTLGAACVEGERRPVPDMIEQSERTRSGWVAASGWLIMPPIEAPTRWAESISSWSSSPAVSAAMSSSV